VPAGGRVVERTAAHVDDLGVRCFGLVVESCEGVLLASLGCCSCGQLLRELTSVLKLPVGPLEL
jgi:hypothetical protein